MDAGAIIILWIMLSFVSGAIAASKGRSFFGYFLVSLLLSPIVGLPLAFGMTDRRDK